MMSGILESNAQRTDAPESGPAQMRDLANREPGTIEGTLLVMTCWCTVLASGVLSPVLPQVAHRFAYMPQIELLVGLVATMPALMVSLSAIPMGWLADRIGHRNVLFGALLLYGVAGIVPYWLEGIWAIIATRAFVGLGEAGAMITGTALIGLRFRGARRGRWLAAQIASANILGIFALQVGGFLGLLGTPRESEALHAVSVHRAGVTVTGMHELAGHDAVRYQDTFTAVLEWVTLAVGGRQGRSWCRRVPGADAPGLYARLHGPDRPPEPFLILDWSTP